MRGKNMTRPLHGPTDVRNYDAMTLAEVIQVITDLREERDKLQDDFHVLVDDFNQLKLQRLDLVELNQRLFTVLRRYRIAMNEIYNHSAAARSAVVQHFGTIHDLVEEEL